MFRCVICTRTPFIRFLIPRLFRSLPYPFAELNFSHLISLDSCDDKRKEKETQKSDKHNRSLNFNTEDWNPPLSNYTSPVRSPLSNSSISTPQEFDSKSNASDDVASSEKNGDSFIKSADKRTRKGSHRNSPSRRTGSPIVDEAFPKKPVQNNSMYFAVIQENEGVSSISKFFIIFALFVN